MIIGIFTHFFAVETTLAERQFFRALAKLVGRRAARLSACGIAAIVSKMGYLDEGCVVGADGSLYKVSQTYSFTCMPTNYLYRNIRASQRGCTKVCKISSAIRESELRSLPYSDIELNVLGRNIVTTNAEDGSGIGAAIIAGMLRST